MSPLRKMNLQLKKKQKIKEFLLQRLPQVFMEGKIHLAADNQANEKLDLITVIFSCLCNFVANGLFGVGSQIEIEVLFRKDVGSFNYLQFSGKVNRNENHPFGEHMNRSGAVFFQYKLS